MKALLIIVGIVSVCVGQQSDIDNGNHGSESKLPEINEKQSELVEKLQIQNGNIITDDYFRSKNFATGLLSRNKWNVVAASKSLKRLLLWRSANHIEKLGKSELDSELFKFIPYNITSDVTKDRCPVVLVDAAKWLISDFIESHEYVRDALKLFNEFVIQMFEKSRLAIKNSKCDQALFVADGKELNIKNFADANTLSSTVHIITLLDKYYPNLYKKIVLINADSDFVGLVNVVLPYFGQTSKDIVLFKEEESKQAQEFLSQYLDIDYLKKI